MRASSAGAERPGPSPDAVRGDELSPRVFSAVVPHRTERDPQALLPIIPPTVQRLCVDGSGPTRSPWTAAARLRSSRTVPGSTVAVRASGSSARTPARCRERSTTSPDPIALPAMLVPAPRIVSGTPASAASATTSARSSRSRGATTAAGSTR